MNNIIHKIAGMLQVIQCLVFWCLKPRHCQDIKRQKQDIVKAKCLEDIEICLKSQKNKRGKRKKSKNKSNHKMSVGSQKKDQK